MRLVLRCAMLCVVALSGVPHAQTPTANDAAAPRPLGPDSVVTRQGATGDRHEYTVDLEINTFFEISVSQDAAELSLALFDVDGLELMSINMAGLTPLPERLMFIASRAGAHRIEVTLLPRGDQDQFHYELRVLALRPANDRERRRQRCFTATAEAGHLARRPRLLLKELGEVNDLLRRAAACWQLESDADLEAATLMAAGVLSSLFAEFRLEAAAAFERLIQILRAHGRDHLVLLILDRLIIEYNDDGRFDRSRETAADMQRLAAKLGSRPGEGRAFQLLALAEFSLGDYDSARRATLSALEIAGEVQDARLLAMAHLYLGRLDETAGDYDAALARYERGLRYSQDRRVNALLTSAVGFVHLRRNEHDAAARQFEARLAMASQLVDRDAEALARVGLGDVRWARGDRQGAGDLYAAAAEALRRGVPLLRCIAFQRLGRLALAEGRLDEATAQFAEMRAINQAMGNPSCEAEAQAGIADVAHARGDLETADTAARAVLEISEQSREATPNLESRALGFGALAPAFERAVEISMLRADHGDREAASRALVLNERALARSLLDRLADATANPSRAAPGPLALERRHVREQWRVRAAQLQVASQTSVGTDRTATLRREMTALELQLRDLEARNSDPDAGRGRLTSVTVPDLDAILALLDDDTTLIEYALGERRSFVWVVSPRGIRALQLPPRAEIEAAARAVHSDFTTPLGAMKPAAAAKRRALSRLVLEPAASLLTGRRLVVVAGGALSLVPFAALPDTREPMGESPLLSRFEIVYVPSASTLAAMRGVMERRAPPSKHSVVFADPIFEMADPRVSARAADNVKRTPEAVSIPSRNASEAVAARTLLPLGASFPRLPFSRIEANALNALAPGHVTTFMDGRATRDRALGEALSDYRFIHFATHGVVRPDAPSLSSIVLSFVDASGTSRDPLLTLPDVYDMRLNADVVVLSACSTAEGKYVPGEGPIGLARGFMHAGARRVVASNWRVNDLATAELMKRFYRGMLVDRLPAAAALRAAQRQIAAIPRWSSPYYWAPFVLQGDWR